MSLLLGLALCALQDGMPPFDPPVLVPPAQHVEPRFEPFLLPEDARIVATDEALVAIAHVLAGDLEDATGRTLPVVEGDAGAGDLILSTGGAYVVDLSSKEGFAIEVFGDHVALMGKTPLGVARAAARVLQLPEVDLDADTVVFPAVMLSDEPKEMWRGLAVRTVPRAIEEGKYDALARAIDDAYHYGWNAVVYSGPTLRADAKAHGTDDFYQRYVDLASARGIELYGERDLGAAAAVELWVPGGSAEPAHALPPLIHDLRPVLVAGTDPVDGLHAAWREARAPREDRDRPFSGTLSPLRSGDTPRTRSAWATACWTGAVPAAEEEGEGAESDDR